MARRHWAWRSVQRTVAFAAAYALVLQVLLMSALGAAAVGQASTAFATPLCVGSGTDAPEKATPHCPLCLGRVDVAILPPPVQMPHLDRVAIELRYRVEVRDSLRVALPRSPQQPRAPPAFA